MGRRARGVRPRRSLSAFGREMARVSTIYVTRDLSTWGCELSEGREDRFRDLESEYKDYTVYDQHYEKIGKVDDLFVDETDTPEYIGVKTGFLGMKSTLIPMALARVNDRRKLIEVAVDKDAINNAPTFDDDKDITPEYEDRVHAYFGLEPVHSSGSRPGYGDYYASGDPSDARRDEDLSRAVDTEYGERVEESAHPTPGGGATGAERHGPPVVEPGVSDSVDRDEARRQLGDRPGVDRSGVSAGGGLGEGGLGAGASVGRTSETGEGTRSGEGQAAGMRIYKRSRRGGV
jgi:hypothetical protein